MLLLGKPCASLKIKSSLGFCQIVDSAKAGQREDEGNITYGGLNRLTPERDHPQQNIAKQQEEFLGKPQMTAGKRILPCKQHQCNAKDENAGVVEVGHNAYPLLTHDAQIKPHASKPKHKQADGQCRTEHVQMFDDGI